MARRRAPLSWSGLHREIHGVLLVECPLEWVVANVGTNSMKVSIIADNMVVEPCLPDRVAGCTPFKIDSFRCNGFEASDN